MNKKRFLFILKIMLSVVALSLGIVYTLCSSGFLADFSSNFPLKSGAFILIFNTMFLLFALFVDVEKFNFLKNEKLKNILTVVFFIIIPPVSLFSFEALLSCTFSLLSFTHALIILYTLQAFLFLISRRIWIASSFFVFLYFLFLLANDTVIHSRGIPILPQDIFSFKTASAVMGNYPIVLGEKSYCNLIFLLAILFLLFKLNLKTNNIPFLISTCILCVIIATSGFLITMNIDKSKFIVNNFDTNDTIKNNGIFLTFVLNFKNMQVEKPTNYNKNTAITVYNETTTPQTQNIDADMPNIIVIMNESFSDLSVLGQIDTSDDFLTNFNNLKKESLSGKMLVSVLGGNTANTEFEFLTGLSMAFLPAGSVAYTQYINKEIPTIASWLSSLGYKTIAFHPFWERCWNRNEVYNLFGFDDFISIEDMSTTSKNADKTAEIKFDIDGKPFGDFEYIRGLLSDGEDYKKLKEIFESKNKDEKLFLFNITIQNHGGYNVYLNEFENTVKLNNTDKYKDVEQYLSLIQKSDKYLKDLIDYFRTQEEPVIILFFGDHQPWLSKEFYSEIQKEDNSLIKKIHKYTVPYLIWSNKGLDKSLERPIISPNFLSEYLLEVSNIPKSNFLEFLGEVNKEVPALNLFAYNAGNGVYKKFKSGNLSEKLKEYRDYQYYTLFDKKAR